VTLQYDRPGHTKSEFPMKHKSPYKLRRFRSIAPKMDLSMTPTPAVKQTTTPPDPSSPASTVSSPSDGDSHLPTSSTHHSPAFSAPTTANPPSRPPSAQFRPATGDSARKPPVLHTFLPTGSSNKRAHVPEELVTSKLTDTKNKRAHHPGELGTFIATGSRIQGTKESEESINKRPRHTYAEAPTMNIGMRPVRSYASYAGPPAQVASRGAPRPLAPRYGHPEASFAPIRNHRPAVNHPNPPHMYPNYRLYGNQASVPPHPPVPQLNYKLSAVPEGMVIFVVGAECGRPNQPVLSYKISKALISQYCPGIYYLARMVAQDYFELPFVVTSTFDKLAAWMEQKQFPHDLVKYSQTNEPYAILIDIYDLAHQFGINVLKDECLNAMEWMRLMSGKVPSVQCLNRVWFCIVRDHSQGTPHRGIEMMFIDWYMALVPSPRDVPNLELQMELHLMREPAIALMLAYANASANGRNTEIAKAEIYHQTNGAREMPFVRGHPKNGKFWESREVLKLREGWEVKDESLGLGEGVGDSVDI